MTHIQWRQADTSLLGNVGSCKTWVLRSPVLLKFDLAILAFNIFQRPFKSSSPTWLNDPSLPSSSVLQSHKPHRAQQHCMMRSIAPQLQRAEPCCRTNELPLPAGGWGVPKACHGRQVQLVKEAPTTSGPSLEEFKIR